MKAISLFSGMGGDSLGIQNAGIELIAYSEINKIAQETHNKNYLNTTASLLQQSIHEMILFSEKLNGKKES